MPVEDIAVFFGLLIVLAHFFSGRIPKKSGKFLSFATGISVTYIFLYLMPEVMMSTTSHSLIFVLLGFSVLRVLEIHIHRHHSLSIMKRELKELHASIFFIYHFFLGVVLYNILGSNILGGALFFFPLLFHTTISSASLVEMDKKISGIRLRLVLSLSTLVGITISILVRIPHIVDAVVLGFITGALLYVIIRDSMPKETRAQPSYFLLGVILYTVLITVGTIANAAVL